MTNQSDQLEVHTIRFPDAQNLEFVALPDKWTSPEAEKAYDGLKMMLIDLQRSYQIQAEPILRQMSKLHEACTIPQGYLIAKNTCESTCSSTAKTEPQS